MKPRVIQVPGMGPIFLQNADYDRIYDLKKRLHISETEVIQCALKHFENTSGADIAYLCDGKECKACNNIDCQYTLDIRHAKNFTEIVPGKFIENE